MNIFPEFIRSSNQPQIQNLNVNEFEKQIVATNSEQLIDVRTPQEFARSHIPNAKNININGIAFRKEIEKLDKSKPVLVYCMSGGRSKSAMEVFREAGFATVYNLSGGITAWSSEGKPIDQDLFGKGDLSSKYDQSIVLTEDFVLVDCVSPEKKNGHS